MMKLTHIHPALLVCLVGSPAFGGNEDVFDLGQTIGAETGSAPTGDAVNDGYFVVGSPTAVTSIQPDFSQPFSDDVADQTNDANGNADATAFVSVSRDTSEFSASGGAFGAAEAFGDTPLYSASAGALANVFFTLTQSTRVNFDVFLDGWNPIDSSLRPQPGNPDDPIEDGGVIVALIAGTSIFGVESPVASWVLSDPQGSVADTFDQLLPAGEYRLIGLAAANINSPAGDGVRHGFTFNFEGSVIPSPGATALLTLCGLYGCRRRRI